MGRLRKNNFKIVFGKKVLRIKRLDDGRIIVI
jgi:L-2-hydroxyglutarate oxidase LhgO